ncbi:MAG TPA: hypothetical protein VH797_01305 [Nitrososphaeraceae archaeon]
MLPRCLKQQENLSKNLLKNHFSYTIAIRNSQPMPSMLRSNPYSSESSVKLLTEVSVQFRSGGGYDMQESG